MTDATSSLKARAREELRSYAIVTAYLYVCFGALLLYRSALLLESGGSVVAYGTAIVKALILGKFILLGEAARVGTRLPGGTLWRTIATKSLLFFLLLVALTVIEELLVGRAHGRPFAQTIAEFEQRSVLELLATCLLLLLVLIPLIAVKEFSRALGPGVLARLLTGSARDTAGSS
jgi:hypothetical protein